MCYMPETKNQFDTFHKYVIIPCKDNEISCKHLSNTVPFRKRVSLPGHFYVFQQTSKNHQKLLRIKLIFINNSSAKTYFGCNFICCDNKISGQIDLIIKFCWFFRVFQMLLFLKKFICFVVNFEYNAIYNFRLFIQLQFTNNTIYNILNRSSMKPWSLSGRRVRGWSIGHMNTDNKLSRCGSKIDKNARHQLTYTAISCRSHTITISIAITMLRKQFQKLTPFRK